MMKTAIGKQRFKAKIPFNGGSNKNCLISILNRLKKMRMNDVYIDFKNKKNFFKWVYNSLYASIGIITLKASRSLL